MNNKITTETDQVRGVSPRVPRENGASPRAPQDPVEPTPAPVPLKK